jgi:hypothetical protein
MTARLALLITMLLLVLAAAQGVSAAPTGGLSPARDQATVVVPKVVGMRMDRSTRLLHARGLRVNEECPKAMFGCWIKANWWICRQSPRPGARLGRYAVVITYGVRNRGEGC